MNPALVPALKSWWMKLHVPANFIGYGTFALAAMVAFAYLIKMQASETHAGTSWRPVAAGRGVCALNPSCSARTPPKAAAATGWCTSAFPR